MAQQDESFAPKTLKIWYVLGLPFISKKKKKKKNVGDQHITRINLCLHNFNISRGHFRIMKPVTAIPTKLWNRLGLVIKILFKLFITRLSSCLAAASKGILIFLVYFCWQFNVVENVVFIFGHIFLIFSQASW